MQKELKKVLEFHKKFNRPISEKPTVELVSEKQAEFRHFLISEEVDEYLEGVKKGDLENVAKELADVLYAVYGTIIEHGLQDKIEDIFAEVHNSHMTKVVERGEQKLKKGKDYKEADITKFFKE